MDTAAEARPSPGAGRKTNLRFALVLLGVIIVAIPFGFTINAFGVTVENPELSRALLGRLAALLAVSFLFLEIMTGSFRPLLARLFPRTWLYQAHVYFGLAGLGMVITHFVLLLPVLGNYDSGSQIAYMVLGTIASLLLLATILTALDLKKFKKTWRWLHLFNYVVFFLAIIHALFLGGDRSLVAFKVILLVYGGLALAGLIYRAVTMQGWKGVLRRREGQGSGGA